MPLLKKRTFEKASSPEFLRDDEEVFYCEITNEIFRNYEEFAERMLLCTSMVWTCAMTGKSNLTYEEALESEENAKKSIKEFPVELRIPILYVGSKTKRTGFGDMAEDVFSYCKDRYFIGEKIEASFTANKWVESHVLQVIAPNPSDIRPSPKNGSPEKHSNPSSALYKYEIEHFNADDRDISEIMIVDFNQIRRKKTVFSREKCKLFLKQYVEQDSKGHWVIKSWALKEFGIENMKFDKIFSGPPPNFDSSKRFEKLSEPKKPAVPNGKKTRQETLAKYLTKANGAAKTNGADAAAGKKNSDILERMEKRKAEFEKMREKMKEEKLAQKQKQKVANMELSNRMRDWHKPKEDLELENQQALPSFPTLMSKLPSKYLGDVLMIMEFAKSFQKILKTKDYFPELSFDVMERAFMEKEVAGPLVDLIHMFLSAIFRQQEEENKEYSMQLAKPTYLDKIDLNNMSLDDAAKFATLAGKWSKEQQGLMLRNLPLYSLTLTEVLRLHLLSSGAKLRESGEKGRFMQRGGYDNTDDPGLLLRIHKPHILKALAVKNVVQLKMKDKICILTCLMDQLLTYADIRDVIEDRIEKNRQATQELKTLHNTEKKRETEHNAATKQLKREAKTNKQDPKVTAKALDALTEAEEKRKLQYEKDVDRLMRSAYDAESYLGMDRAFRKYYKFESVPGVFIDNTEENPGICLPEAVRNHPELINAEDSVIMEHLKKIVNKRNSSDKENSPVKKSPKKVNGDAISDVDIKQTSSQLLMCSADKDCLVHSANRSETKWYFVPQTEMLEDLMNALNKRGIRENELSQALKADKDTLVKLIRQTPVQQLNMALDIQEEESRTRVSTRGKKTYSDANFNFPIGTSIEEILRSTLTDDILEMEEKIYSGSLGQLHVKNREDWRNALLEKDYDNFNREIVRRTYIESDTNMDVDDEEEEIIPEIKKKDAFTDPGTYLGTSKDSQDSEEEVDNTQSEDMKKAVECLAIALAQVAQAVEPKFLQKPLGNSSSQKVGSYVPMRNHLGNWEESLLISTSFSQIFLHYSNLDSCIMWSRSTLLTRCRICKRQKDSENMLLCDSCNLGHHLYCLKPKLKSIPKGDWFCDKCTAVKEKVSRKVGSEVIPKKKRRLFIEEEQEEEEEQQQEEEQQEEEEEEQEEEEEESEDEQAEESEQEEEEDDEEETESVPIKVELCNTCNSGGVLISCDECNVAYHKECVDPPLRKAKSSWICSDCRGINHRKERESEREHAINNNRTRSGRSVLNINDDEDSDNEVLSNHISSQRKRSLRRESGRDDLPLHNAALQDLLKDVMRHPDAWPFLRPVQKNEVPDYHQVIAHPMDFGTIKYKLNMGEYSTDAQLMYDAALVFDNCNTYNEMDSEIYRCGERLLESFRNKCSELGLKIPSKEQDQEENKRRRKK